MSSQLSSQFFPFIAFVSATVHTEELEVTVVCTNPAPSTVTQAVTVTAFGGSNNQYTSLLGNVKSIQTTTTTTSKSSPLVTYPTSSISSTHTPTIHGVILGVNGELKYGANQVDAAIGDIIRFDFNSTNHTVTQSSFNTPCEPLAGGFN